MQADCNLTLFSVQRLTGLDIVVLEVDAVVLEVDISGHSGVGSGRSGAGSGHKWT